jgi:hypothetical protein
MMPTPTISGVPLEPALRSAPPVHAAEAKPAAPAAADDARFQYHLDQRVQALRPATAAPRPEGGTTFAAGNVGPSPYAGEGVQGGLAPRLSAGTALTPHASSGAWLVPPPANTIEGTGAARWQSVAQNWRDYLRWSDAGEAQIKARGLNTTHALVVGFRDEQRRRMIGLQIELGAAQFQMELVSKVIEHGTGGTRQVLQTQA